jgi:hypothetical protein
MQDRKEYLRAYGKKWAAEHRDHLRAKRRIRLRLYPESEILVQIRQRCNNPNNAAYPAYGGRGIKNMLGSVDEIFSSIGRRPEGGYSIDRIDNNDHYRVGNIRWATSKQQANNRRDNVCRIS